MTRICLIISILLLSVATYGQDTEAETRAAVIQFVDSLGPLEKKRAMLQFGDTARVQWNNLPVGLRARAGASLGSMSDRQRRLVHRILSAALSSQGYLKATSIMHLDNLLNMFVDTMNKRGEIDDRLHKYLRDLQWSHQNYFVAVFGDPRTDQNWGFKIEGHHLSINLSFVGKQLSVTPMFVGTDPAEYTTLEYAGWRVLLKEEDYGLKLIRSLPEGLRKKATMSTEVPGDIITAAESGKRLIDPWGLKTSEMGKEQQKLVEYLIKEFVFNMEHDKAEREYARILEAGIGNVYFGWIGAYEEKKPHYYVLNGPTFLIEFDNNGGPRREKGNEYGEDVLKKHYQADHKR